MEFGRKKETGVGIRKWRIGFIVFLNLLFLLSHDAFAHVRHYVWNQEYQTLPKGGAELESYVTLKVPDGTVTNENEWEYQEELEYGVTDHFTLAHYERWETNNQPGPDDATKYSGFKFEAKYRIGEKGKYPVDPLLYLEWSTDPRNHDNPNSIEAKLVLSKDFDKLNVTYNQIMDSELGSGGRTEQEFTAGINYEVIPDIRAGVEMKGQYWNPGSHRNKLSLGPTLAYEHKYFWIAAGTLFPVNHAANDHEARVIVGVPFG